MQQQKAETAGQEQTVAAIDLGSNSFHMIVARVHDGSLQIIDKMREMVRLGEGLTDDKHLTPEVAARAIACLERFGQRLGSLPSEHVMAVGTNTLRQVSSADAFLTAAQQALGHPIEIIAGREEARLIYLGVSHGLASSGEAKQLVIDIGGGSTELIVGEGFRTERRESLHMGCVSISRSHFADGLINSKRMKQAELACAVVIRPVRSFFRDAGWSRAVGSSGTIKAIRKVVTEEGWSQEGISARSLEKLRKRMIEAGSLDKLQLKGLSEERKPVFAGGVAVLSALFKHIGIEQMQVSNEALREGLIYDMIGRSRQEDARERTVRSLSKRYNVDQEQAQRVESTALALYHQVIRPWKMLDSRYSSMLSWAAQLHEVGLTVSHSQFQKHGSYLLENSDLSGFTRQEQRVLAAMVRGHRRKFPTSVFEALPQEVVLCTKQLCVLLRLAVLMHRSRSPVAKPQALLDVNGLSLTLEFPAGWLASHPLTRLELKQEANYLQAAGFSLTFS
ncbi:exopolyphosphatase [endosymbiont of Ridgeia piscesae]|jgi:exopolyphosphatase/guanosine-5'-triphosphate,3'-diphosphate pyrophosphatase|uniref:Exopolyphosphatase n=3 Tax=endosymbiont of Ridgeia piscesae TaxID=54398 RepID=A0A0T5YZT4_9GAMM|nr:exopolyphosphatase [endosymbiont of Ridgeia piscesae]KRT55726.1 exopolyphosphatase [endosymbiont of Ridgeia piscesae]